MKPILSTAAITLAALLLLGCNFAEEIEAITIHDIDISRIQDGVYRGTEKHFPVTAVVDVEVRGGRIVNIDIVRHLHGPGHGADAIAQRVLDQQSLMVDAVSGATGSSQVVLKAIERALSGDT
jgi:uncharacterized protein with FMN-binding domain